MATDIWRELEKIPPVTRVLALGTCAVSLPCMVKLVSPYNIILSWPLVLHRWQFWRIFTSFLYGGEGINFLFSLIMLYRASNSLESQLFHLRTADYSFALGLMASGILALNVKLGGMIFHRPLFMAILYLEAQANPEALMNLYGFITMKQAWFPWAMVALDVVMSGPALAMQSLTGIIAAHFYWYFFQIYPRTHNGRTLLSTPKSLKKWLGNGNETVTAAGGGIRLGTAGVTAFAPTRSSSSSNDSASTTGHRWGSGHRLGS